MKAAVFYGAHQPLVIEEIDVAEPIGREVLVRTTASGVCHSDLHYVDGTATLPGATVLGHEATGFVEKVGPEARYVKPGDRIISCPSIFCGECESCLTGHPARCDNRPRRSRAEGPRLSKQGEKIWQFANISSYAEQMLLHENAVVKVDDDIPHEIMALIGCGVTTGLGAAINTAKVRPGSMVAIFGCGGVGLSAMQGAVLCGARMVIAVDINEFKLRTAMDLGATHVVDASTRDPVQAVRELTGGGVDFAFEALGMKQTAEQAYESLRRGGVATIIGVLPDDAKIEIDGRSLLTEKKLQGSIMGSNRFRVDMPMYIDLYKQGRLKLDEMVTRRGRLEDVNEAFRAMKAGEVARTVLTFD